eukprot:c30178_g1_i1 orf=309-1859(+)
MAAPDVENVGPVVSPLAVDASAPVVDEKEVCVQAQENANVGEKDVAVILQVEPSLPSFKEESYFISDLKDSEKKALQELKLTIEEAVKSNEFVPPLPASGPDAAGDAEEGKKEGNAIKVKETFIEPQVSATECSAIVPESGYVETRKETDLPCKVVEDKDVSINKDVLAEDISLWGVPLLHTHSDERTDVILLKFLRARDFKVNEAFTMLKNTMLWRKSFGADKILEEDFGTSLDNVAYMHGTDKEGHPVCYNVYGAFQDPELYQQTFGDAEKIGRFLRWRIRLMEEGLQRLNFRPAGASAMVQITDLRNAPGPARKELKTASKQAVTLLQDNYPELVVKKVFINVPWYFSAVYLMFSRFLTPRTKSKFVVARRGKVAEALFKFIPPEQVPVHYGGLGRSNDPEFNEGKTKCTELVIKAGEKQTIEIPVSDVELDVIWDLIVVGWNVTYGAEYYPSGEDGHPTIIEKAKRITSTEPAIRQTFKTSGAGKIVLTIDNVASRKKKMAVYRFVLKTSSK